MSAEPMDDHIRVPGTERVFRRPLMLTVLLAILAMTMMAISSINVALPSIEASIGATHTDIQWMLSGYSLSFGMILIAAGRTGDVLGRSSCFVAGVGIFTLASLGCALAGDPVMLNILRITQGIGAGVATPQVNGMIVQYFSGQHRARAFALFGLVISVSVAVAPMVTGLLIDWLGPNLGWRASFLWNVPIGLATMALAGRWLPFAAERTRRAARQRGEQVSTRVDLDPLGMVLLSGAVLLVMLPFMIRQAAAFWLVPVGLGLAVAWLAWERHYIARGRAPMVDLRLFGYRSFTHAVAISGTHFLGMTSVFVVLAFYLQNGLHASALAVGVLGVPNAIASAFSSMWSGDRVLQAGRKIVVAGFGCSLLGVGGCIVLGQMMAGSGRPSYLWLAVPLILLGLGVGAVNSCNQTLSQAEIPAAVGGTAGAIKQVAERLGTAIGNAMITAVLFLLVPLSWTAGFTGALGIIAAILLIALILAVIDLRMLGDGNNSQTRMLQ